MMGVRLGTLFCNLKRDVIYVYRFFDTCVPLSLMGKLGVEFGRDRSQTRRIFLVLLVALSWSICAPHANSSFKTDFVITGRKITLPKSQRTERV